MFLIYTLIGLTVSFCVSRLFPPNKGYSPPMHIVLMALLTFTFAWPVVVLIIARYYQIEDRGRNVVRERMRGATASSL